MSSYSTPSTNDDTSDLISDWTDIVQNVSQYNPTLSNLVSWNSSDEVFKLPKSRKDGRRTLSPSLKSTNTESSRRNTSFGNHHSYFSSESDPLNSSEPYSPSKFHFSEQLISSYASSYASSSGSLSPPPRKRAHLSNHTESSISGENDSDFEISGIRRFNQTMGLGMDYFHPRATSTPFVSPPDPKVVQRWNTSRIATYPRKPPYFRSEDEEAVYYLVSKYLMTDTSSQGEKSP
ncbi:uncharacterized protein LOC133184223 [Saccostrea echinata]|uniref:uncharacterized protein LOC133184223 n=1 Tax=Saccostrea echinata TaxID=191078 RepID=UPI002A810D25|nr:uncharacterized protein LOC133184223 [Saccostrea echinata]